MFLNVGSARLRVTDILHPIKPKTPAPTIPTNKQKEEKGKIVVEIIFF